MKKFTWIWVAAIVLVVMTGCGQAKEEVINATEKAAENAVENAVEDVVSENADDSQMDSQKDASEEIGVEKPANFPSDAPLMTDAVITEVVPEKGYNGEDGYKLTYSTKSKKDEVLAFYQTAFEKTEPDYENAEGYFFENVELGSGDFVRLIWVQDKITERVVVVTVELRK